jgi:hypothetical protein
MTELLCNASPIWETIEASRRNTGSLRATVLGAGVSSSRRRLSSVKLTKKLGFTQI